jgi:hypothetical protein
VDADALAEMLQRDRAEWQQLITLLDRRYIESSEA